MNNHPWGAMYPTGGLPAGPPTSTAGNPPGTFSYDDQATMAAAMAWNAQDWPANLSHYYNYGSSATSDVYNPMAAFPFKCESLDALFQIQYPSDPCPSTSLASQASSSTKSSPQTPQTPALASMYYPDYYGGAMNLNICDNWKMSTVKKKGLVPAPIVPYRTGPGTNNVRVRTAEKYRAVYNEYQRLELEKEYLTNNFISSERKAILSTELNLTERQIKIWFQNRRAKQRREDSRKH
ncbi:hypothetical protein QR680_012832 [Steinernema hermaphroditum]|uniref:Homeobox domain-containing protein n=1 Tax=Steinernema hermaphroditum TaxID=289476 RepID=A0AA39I3D5_9BILA|nr:hypothetical protein QR680_012832 [Steinernema hermaphroditum]